MLSPTLEATPPPKEKDFPMPPAGREEAGSQDAATHVREISMWLRALHSFFDTCNQPLAEGSQEGLVAQDWTNELRIVRRTLLRASELVFRSVHF